TAEEGRCRTGTGAADRGRPGRRLRAVPARVPAPPPQPPPGRSATGPGERGPAPGTPRPAPLTRSEERRVGKECGDRWARQQAEDGIRDRNVTGVQTCALPIYR